MMQRRDAEVHFPGQLVDAQRLFEMTVEPFDRLADAMALAVGDGDFVQPVALGAAQQAVQNLPSHQGREHGDVLGVVQQAHQA